MSSYSEGIVTVSICLPETAADERRRQKCEERWSIRQCSLANGRRRTKSSDLDVSQRSEDEGHIVHAAAGVIDWVSVFERLDLWPRASMQ